MADFDPPRPFNAAICGCPVDAANLAIASEQLNLAGSRWSALRRARRNETSVQQRAEGRKATHCGHKRPSAITMSNGDSLCS